MLLGGMKQAPVTCHAGLFLAPQMVGEALKGGRLLAAVAARCGIVATPPHGPLDWPGAMLNKLFDDKADICRSQGSRWYDTLLRRLHAAADSPSYITTLRLGSRAAMLAFCGAVQAASPIGSYITPTPGARCNCLNVRLWQMISHHTLSETCTVLRRGILPALCRCYGRIRG